MRLHLVACLCERLGSPARVRDEGPEWECRFQGVPVRLVLSTRGPDRPAVLRLHAAPDRPKPLFGPHLIGLRFIEVPTCGAAERVASFFDPECADPARASAAQNRGGVLT
jgi:hypothetical protein